VAFPTTGILDDFNRADSTDPGSNWSADQFTAGNANFQILGQRSAPNGGGTVVSEAWWNANQFGPDCEAYCTLRVTASQEIGLTLRLQNPGVADSCDGYSYWHDLGNSNSYILRFDNDVGTQLGAGIVQAVDADDRFGFSAVGDQLTAHFSQEGGDFSELSSRTDGTYSSAGYIGANFSTNLSNRQDDFGGGTVVTVAFILPARRRGR